jgi:hypothetical protein
MAGHKAQRHRLEPGGVQISSPWRIEPLNGNGVMAAPFRATFTSDRTRITIDVDVVNGAPLCRRYEVERTDGDGLELMTTEVMRGVNLRALMANGCADAAMQALPGDSHTYELATSVEAIEAVLGTVRRRAPITDAELKRFSALYRKRHVAGHMKEFAEELGYSERHAWRLLKLTRERGFLPSRRA